MGSKKRYGDIDEYISTFPPDVRRILQQLRQAIKESAPEAEEVISYQMPAFKQRGILVWFAAFKDHIGFFPKASGVAAFKNRLAGYEISKGTIRFSLTMPIPIDLIKEIVKFRAKEDEASTQHGYRSSRKISKNPSRESNSGLTA